MEQSPSWGADSNFASEEIPRNLWYPKVHYHFRKSPPLVPSQMVPVHALPSYFWRTFVILSSHLSLGLPRRLFPSIFVTETLMHHFLSSIRATPPAHLFLVRPPVQYLVNPVGLRAYALRDKDGGWAPHILYFGLEGGHLLDSHPCRFTPKEIVLVCIGPARISLYVISLRPQMSPYVQVTFFEPTYKRDVCNIVFGTVCRDRRWPSWARQSLTSPYSASLPRASTRLWRRPLTTCWSAAEIMQAKFASKYFSQDVNRVPLHEFLGVAHPDLRNCEGRAELIWEVPHARITGP